MSLFTKLQYEFLADYLREMRVDWLTDYDVDAITNELADRLEKDNPRFMRARFLKAAGVADES